MASQDRKRCIIKPILAIAFLCGSALAAPVSASGNANAATGTETSSAQRDTVAANQESRISTAQASMLLFSGQPRKELVRKRADFSLVNGPALPLRETMGTR